MIPLRIIARLDIKGPNVIKGIQLEGLRIVGNPKTLAKKYYDQGADELLYIDTVASLYERANILEIVRNASESGVRIPLTVGGGVRSIDDIRLLLHAGADKVAINTGAVKNPKLISESSRIFGSQCIVGSIEAKRKTNNAWEVYIDNGRESTGLSVIEWAKRLEELGAGEILITSVDNDGTRKGFDYNLIKSVMNTVQIPVIASGGAGNKEDVLRLVQTGFNGAMAIASILHYDNETIDSIKEELSKNGYSIRNNVVMKNNAISNSGIKVSILDYGAGNMHSVSTALKELGYDAKIIHTAEEVKDAKVLLVPGDGAFNYAMQQLSERKLIEPITDYARQGKPLIGICLGMQLLMDTSEEFENTRGLGLVQGEVLNLKKLGLNNSYRLPHMGWNKIILNGSRYNDILFDKEDNGYYYFEHSFGINVRDYNDVLGISEYGNSKFCSILKKNNIIGFQFHPEKSGEYGMKLLDKSIRSVI